MSYQFPPDVAKLVQDQMLASQYQSEDEVLRDALLVLREFKAREEQLIADVQLGTKEADLGLARPLDVNALIDRCTLRLAAEGIPG